MHKLKYLSETVLVELRADISLNLERYTSTGFLDLSLLNGWSMELGSVEIDQTTLAELDPSGGSDVEVKNSLLVFDALPGLTAAMATEERIWVRLTHVECLEYARNRWPLKVPPMEKSGIFAEITGQKERAKAGADKVRQQNLKQIETHYFAKGRNGYRDDNAVSRLWWNAYIARLVDPTDPEGALRQILKTADIRSNLIERPMLSNRASLMRGIVRCMRNHPDITETESTFRSFMKAVNFRGGGVLFEAMEEADIDAALEICRVDALKSAVANKTAA